LTNPVSQLPNKNFQTQQFYPQKAHVNIVEWTPNLEPPRFPRDDKNISLGRPKSINARLANTVDLENTGIANVALSERRKASPSKFYFII